jgi:flagellar FliL protein
MATPSSPAFLKTTDVEASAKAADAISGSSSQGSCKKFLRIILFTTFGVLVLAASAACLLFFRHRIAAQHVKNASYGSASESGAAPKAIPAAPTVELPLDPFVVNLADAGGHSYARIGLTLQLVSPPAASATSEKKGAAADLSGPRDMVRDTIITVLNQEQSADLLAPGGKQQLKQAIRAAVVARDAQVKIVDIYFTEFLVQQ